MALWLRGRAEHPAGPGLVHRDNSRSPYTVLSVNAPLIGGSMPPSASSGTLITLWSFRSTALDC